MAKTLHDRFCIGLERLGALTMPKKNKYTMYKFPTQGVWTARFIFVGKAGALRQCLRPNSTQSVPCSDRFKQMILDAPLPSLEQLDL